MEKTTKIALGGRRFETAYTVTARHSLAARAWTYSTAPRPQAEKRHQYGDVSRCVIGVSTPQPIPRSTQLHRREDRARREACARGYPQAHTSLPCCASFRNADRDGRAHPSARAGSTHGAHSARCVRPGSWARTVQLGSRSAPAVGGAFQRSTAPRREVPPRASQGAPGGKTGERATDNTRARKLVQSTLYLLSSCFALTPRERA